MPTNVLNPTQSTWFSYNAQLGKIGGYSWQKFLTELLLINLKRYFS